MFFIVSKVAWFVLQPVVAIALLVGLGLLFRGIRRRWPACLAFSGATLLFLVACFSPAGLLMANLLEDRFPRAPLPERIDGIVVLGGGFDTRVARTRDVPELNEAADRLTTAVALARLYPDADIVFSGGAATLIGEGMSEAVAAERFFEAMGIAKDRLILEGRSRNTYENAVFTKALVDPQPGETWLLVTSAFHMSRAIGCFRVAGFDVLPFPADYRTPAGPAVWRPSGTATRNLEKFHFALREYLGLAAYWWTGRIGALFPAPEESQAAGQSTVSGSGTGSSPRPTTP